MSVAPDPVAPPSIALDTPRSGWDTLRMYVDIARPRVVALVVFTGLPVVFLGPTTPSLWKAAWVLLATGLAGAASSALNAYVERESDARMARTRRRPLPAASLLPNAVLAYGVALTLLSTAMLVMAGGPLGAAISLGAVLFYVAGYTMYLKPRTPQNIVIGGAAGAVAPLIASAALFGTISVHAWLLFFIVFLWTPPHFWAIALFRKREYESAGFPMMPSVVGDQPTRWQSLIYTVLVVVLSLVPGALGELGIVYVAVAGGLGTWFLLSVCYSLYRPSPAQDRSVFRVSVAYLFLLYLAMLVDLASPWGIT